MKRVAAVDLGTNTFLCLIAEVEGKTLRVLEDVSRVVRLGEKVHQNKEFTPQALDRASRCLAEFQKVIEKHNVDHVVATATSAARDVKNGSELLRLGEKFGIPIHIIEGSREASLSFAGAVSAIPDAKGKNILVIDVGGGSTELIFRKAHSDEIKAKSFDVGSVRMTEMFLHQDPIDQKEFEEMITYIHKTMAPYGMVKPDLVVAVAGTPTTLACVAQKIDFDESKVEGYVLTDLEIKKLVTELSALPISAKKNIKGLEPLRADVIVAGAALLRCSLEVSGKNQMRVSTRGLRYGVALHHEEFKNKEKSS